MSRIQLLNNETHRDLRILAGHSHAWGDAASQCEVFPEEFVEVQREYPIFFTQDGQTEEYHAIALLGLEAEENLYLDDENQRWRASYIPAFHRRGPFFIGFQEAMDNGELIKSPVIYVDLDDARINRLSGYSLFHEHGGNTAYLDQVASSLALIHSGTRSRSTFFSALQKYDLIESVMVEAKLSETEIITLRGLHALNQEKFQHLSGEAFEYLNSADVLMAAFAVMASQGNMRRLIDKKIALSVRPFEAKRG